VSDQSNKFGEDELTLLGCDVSRVDFSRRRFTRIVIGDGSTLTECNFRDVYIDNGVLGAGRQVSVYNHCRFDKSTFKSVNPGRSKFISCTFDNGRIEDMQFLDAELVDCTFRETLLKDVIFDADTWGQVPGQEAYRYCGNDFTCAVLENVSFRGGIDLSQQRFPCGSDSFVVSEAAEKIAMILDIVSRWPEKFSVEAEVLLNVLLRHTRRKQRDILVDSALFADRLPSMYADQILQAFRER
jgi:hypothetical protein